VQELLRVYLRGKLPLKSDGQITETLKKRLDGVVLAEEWSDIVRYMYAADDAEMLIGRLREAAHHYRSKTHVEISHGRGVAHRGRPRADDGRLPYAGFLQVLLEFQLAGHVHYLSGFVHLFRQLDGKGRGAIHESEFRQLALAIDPSKSDGQIEALLEKVDPHNHQRISFSDSVNALTPDLHRIDEEPHELELARGMGRMTSNLRDISDGAFQSAFAAFR
jgi:hypothetical protein